MPVRMVVSDPSLVQLIEARVRDTTCNRVRDLLVEQTDGGVVVRGQVRNRHTKQLALHAALELLPGDSLSDEIVVS